MKTFVIQKSGNRSPPSHLASKNEEVNLRSPEQPILYDADSPEVPGRMPARTSARPYMSHGQKGVMDASPAIFKSSLRSLTNQDSLRGVNPLAERSPCQHSIRSGQAASIERYTNLAFNYNKICESNGTE
jgi:hypothetical protein